MFLNGSEIRHELIDTIIRVIVQHLHSLVSEFRQKLLVQSGMDENPLLHPSPSPFAANTETHHS